jgi:hypothetical protein
MGLFLRNLKLGDQVVGKVEERLTDDELIIALHGDLLRVHNRTGQIFAVGDPVCLVVKAIRPLRFQLLADRMEQRRLGRIDVNI